MTFHTLTAYLMIGEIIKSLIVDYVEIECTHYELLINYDNNKKKIPFTRRLQYSWYPLTKIVHSIFPYRNKELGLSYVVSNKDDIINGSSWIELKELYLFFTEKMEILEKNTVSDLDNVCSHIDSVMGELPFNDKKGSVLLKKYISSVNKKDKELEKHLVRSIKLMGVHGCGL